MREELFIFFSSLSIGLLAGFKLGFDFCDTTYSRAKCESMGGVYGGGKCFVNGFEVDNQQIKNNNEYR